MAAHAIPLIDVHGPGFASQPPHDWEAISVLMSKPFCVWCLMKRFL